ncbi:MAG: NAD(P)H-dependent glycerol-3-phosphate dehydrogenase [Candidatus Brocadiia bacterium]
MSEQAKKTADETCQNVAVIGCGGWGTALALLLDGIGHKVTIWGVEPEYVEEMSRTRQNPRYLSDVAISESIELTGDMADCVPEADIVVMATPTIYMRDVCQLLARWVHKKQLVVNVAKGIEEETLLTGSKIIEDVCGENIKLAGLYGPSHAEEVAQRMPTTVVATSRQKELAEKVQDNFMCATFRVYTNTDLIGVELGAALKNVIAIAAGVCDGLNFGDNAKSALLTRGLAEIRRLGVALGGHPETFAGLTGLGDLITTCISPHGRNRSVGIRLGQGETLDEILSDMEKVAEGVRTTRSACDLANQHNIEMPVTRQVYSLLFEGKEPREAGMELMQREPRPELDTRE